MILFSPLRTRRLSVRLRELTLGDAIALCKLPAERHELTATEFLRMVARDAEAPQPRYVTDPRLMTVEERTLLVCHYLAQVSADGPDFSLGEGARLSDYVAFDADLKTEGVTAEAAGKRYTVRPLLGVHAEILERLCSARGDWLLGSMACQMQADGEAAPAWAELSDVALMEAVKARQDALRDLPESDFEAMLAAYSGAQRDLTHFFILNFDDHGIVCEPQLGEEAGQKPPARFLASTCVSGLARRLFAQPDLASR